MAPRPRPRPRKQAPPEALPAAPGVVDSAPKSFVLRKGRSSRHIQQLVLDMRDALEPNTAAKLKESKKNKLKDFVNVASQFGVTHLLLFSATGSHQTRLRLARVPHGPTLVFNVNKYTLVHDIQSVQAKPRSKGPEFWTPPLVVFNNLPTATHEDRLLSASLQSLFPAIQVQSLTLSDCRRVVLFDYDSDTRALEFRHFAIQVVPTGVHRQLKRIVQRRVPKLRGLRDISELLDNNEASESEAEDTPDTQVVLPQRYHRSAAKQQSAVRLVEIGPRMQLQLTQVQEGLCEGDFIFDYRGDSFLRKPGSSRSKPAKHRTAAESAGDHNSNGDDDEDEDDDDELFDSDGSDSEAPRKRRQPALKRHARPSSVQSAALKRRRTATRPPHAPPLRGGRPMRRGAAASGTRRGRGRE